MEYYGQLKLVVDIEYIYVDLELTEYGGGGFVVWLRNSCPPTLGAGAQGYRMGSLDVEMSQVNSFRIL